MDAYSTASGDFTLEWSVVPSPSPSPSPLPGPLECSDMTSRSEIKKCKKANPNACSDYFEVKSEKKNKYKMCLTKLGGGKCGSSETMTCPPPTSAPTAAPTVAPTAAPTVAPTSCNVNLASRDVIGKCKKAPLDACSSFYEVAFFTAPALETLRYVWSKPPCPVLGAERRQREVQALLLQARKGVLQEREDHLPGARGGAG